MDDPGHHQVFEHPGTVGSDIYPHSASHGSDGFDQVPGTLTSYRQRSLERTRHLDRVGVEDQPLLPVITEALRSSVQQHELFVGCEPNRCDL